MYFRVIRDVKIMIINCDIKLYQFALPVIELLV